MPLSHLHSRPSSIALLLLTDKEEGQDHPRLDLRLHPHKQTGGILLGERKQQNFVRLRRKQERPSARMASLKAQDRAKLRRSETAEAAPSAEQTQTADQEDQEQAKEDQGREEERVCCTSSESVDSIYLWKYISHDDVSYVYAQLYGRQPSLV